MRFIFGLMLFVTCVFGYGQSTLVTDIQKKFEEKPKFVFRLDARNSFIANKSVKVRAIKVGLEYGKDVTVGLSLNWLDKKFATNKLIVVDKDTFPTTLDFGYLGFYFDYIFYRTKRWTVSIPIQLGIGSSFYGYKAENKTIQRFNSNPILVYEPAMTADYKIIPYIGLGFGVGYRLMLLSNKQIEGNFNSPIYVLKLKVYLGDVYRDVFKRKEK